MGSKAHGENADLSAHANTTLAHIPLKRMRKPEEISAAVALLSSGEASYIIGATLYVNGGWFAN